MIESRSPASSEQEEVWLAVQREPESGRFNIPLDLEFTPSVDVPSLRLALRDVLERHPGLCSTFGTVDGRLMQSVHSKQLVPFVERQAEFSCGSTEAHQWAARATGRPFDLTSPPLVRAELLQCPDGALFVLCIHHLVSDGWSQHLVAQDLLTAYADRIEGREPRFGAPSPYPVSLSSEVEATADRVEVERYWTELLAAELASLKPMADLNRPGSSPGSPAWAETELTLDVLNGIRELARAEQTTPATIVLGAWLTLLHAWSGASEGTSGMLFASRLDDATHEQVGLLARVLPLVSRVDFSMPFRELLEVLGRQVLDSLDNSSVTSERLRAIRHANVGGSLIDSCVYMHFPEDERKWQVGSTRVRVVEHEGPGAKYDFSLCAVEGRQRMRLRIDFDSAVYRQVTAELFLQQLAALLSAAVRDAATTCGSLVTSCDRFAPAVAADRDDLMDCSLLHELVIRHASARPDAIAVRHHQKSVTYGQLVADASALAHWMRSCGVGNEDVVALLLPPGTTSIVLWLATLMAGAAYLPLDPVYPDAQLQMVLDDANPALVIGTSDLMDRVRLPECPTFSVSEALAAAEPFPAFPPQIPVSPDMAFNVLYTSGSTGCPKGVVLPHAGIVRLLNRPDFIPIDENDVFSQLCPLNFDGATYEVWGALSHGAQLVIFDKELTLSPRELRVSFRRYGVTFLTASTPLMNRLIEDVPDLFQTLRHVYCGGEIISVPHIKRALLWAEPGTLLHGYGPTENSFTSTWAPIREVEENARTIPIGAAVPETGTYVVMDHASMLLAPRGVPGELLLSGTGVARGYVGNPVETARRYIPDPYSGRPGTRIYRTGDRVRWTPDGQLEFIGRNDNQIKIRGQRVELGGVESCLSSHQSVEAAFVMVHLNRLNEKEIVGYVQLAPGGSIRELRQHIRGILPAFAVPRYLIPLKQMPLTPNGKIDRHQLPVPSLEAETGEARVTDSAFRGPAAAAQGIHSPRGVDVGGGELLDAVRASWQSVLQHDQFGLDDNFFDVGGHSLILVRLQKSLSDYCSSAPSVGNLLRHTTVRAQATLLSSGATDLGAQAWTLAGQTVSAPVTEPELSPEPVPKHADGQDFRDTAKPAGQLRIVALSAYSDMALQQMRLRLADRLTAASKLRLDDVAITLDQGRERFPHRFAVVAADTAEAAAVLRDEYVAPRTAASGVLDLRTQPRLVHAFGSDLDLATMAAWYQASEPVRRMVRDAGRITTNMSDSDLWAECLIGGQAGSAHACRLAVQYALARFLCDRGARPDVVTGQGVGFLTAALVAGALDFTDAVYLADRLGTARAEGPEDARDEEEITQVALRPPRIPLLAPSGRLITSTLEPGALQAELFTEPDFTKLMSQATGGRPALVADVGVGSIASPVEGAVLIRLLGAVEPGERSLLGALARLWCHGADVDLSAGSGGRRVRLPSYAFERGGTTAVHACAADVLAV
ncbi:amino acid adenylation domain-containing protein [Streptomyces sp. NPDC087908]|uniref:non-ribosomal peptide synthetase n=1 Tax=Streptomyces sp. NPDC087908 TaxID=3365820 RepID=UPI0037FFB390